LAYQPGGFNPSRVGPEGRIIYALAIDPVTPTTLYAGTRGGGVFRSTNGGGSWGAFSPGLTNTDVRALAIDPVTLGVLYAGTAGGGVFSFRHVIFSYWSYLPIIQRGQ
jgi:hypothetical protein